MDIQLKVKEANERLNAANVGVAIELRGNRLYLRATLPPRPGCYNPKNHQQRISLKIYGNPAGIKEAEKEARKVGALVACEEFSWEPYIINEPPVTPNRLVKDWTKAFKEDYFLRRSKTPKSELTWATEYRLVFDALPADEILTPDVIKSAIAKTTPDTRTRRRYCINLAALAKFAGIEFDPRPYRGRYSPRKLTPRDLPDDQAIAQWFFKIDNPAWRWVYGVLATYGLRPHEVFLLDFAQFGNGSNIISVLDGKTGARRVWPIYPEWAEQFELANVVLPKVTGKNNAAFGSRVTHAFERLKIPFCPYDLRHCWAIRSLEFGLDITLAAQQMGHSVRVHTDIYHLWISDRHHQRAFDTLMRRGDRPLPPRVLYH